MVQAPPTAKSKSGKLSHTDEVNRMKHCVHIYIYNDPFLLIILNINPVCTIQ